MRSGLVTGVCVFSLLLFFSLFSLRLRSRPCATAAA